MKDHESASFFERLKKDMEESIAYSRGELKGLRTRKVRMRIKRDKTDYENMSVLEQVKTGLEEALSLGRGQLKLKKTTLPRPRK